MEQAIIVGAQLSQDKLFKISMQELEGLAYACHIEVFAHVTQQMKRIHNLTYLGIGKILEIKAACQMHDIKLVVFNDELSPAQLTHLEAILECVVKDRTLLILEIFAKRARTKEAMLQVEIAQLKHMLPRLKGLTASLSHQQGGKGFRGPGEKKLELNQRHIEKQLGLLKKELAACLLSRQNQRRRRMKQQMKQVALVGYTNAGKSSLMNQLLKRSGKEKVVFEKDMLFATLETSTRYIHIKHQQPFLLIDTVGFVQKLPHHLVDAFKSTLEEVVNADLLIHVVDCSHPHCEQQIKIVEAVLEQIGVKDVPVLYVYNKVDKGAVVRPNYHPSIEISCHTGFQINLLTKRINHYLLSETTKQWVYIPYSDYKAYLTLNQMYSVVFEMEDEKGYTLEAYLNKEAIQYFHQYIKPYHS